MDVEVTMIELLVAVMVAVLVQVASVMVTRASVAQLEFEWAVGRMSQMMLALHSHHSLQPVLYLLGIVSAELRPSAVLLVMCL